jgi:hypothetical protein
MNKFKPSLEINCIVCGKPKLTSTWRAKYCSINCGAKAFRIRQKKIIIAQNMKEQLQILYPDS